MNGEVIAFGLLCLAVMTLGASIFYLTKEVWREMSELADALRKIGEQLEKAKNEIVGKIQALEDALENAGALPADVQDALDELKAKAQALDDIVPDEAV